LSAGAGQDNSFHIVSHVALLQLPTDADVAGPGLDAIVVPTIRPTYLGPAIALAADIGCVLVVLCSTPSQAAQALEECERLADKVFVTYIPADYVDLVPFVANEHPENEVVPSCHVDIARKRNIGLLLARLCGWRTVMFLDDDIRDMTASAVLRAAAMTVRFQAAGFRIGNYPDNSVVCHAHRLAGGHQEVFPGGSGLLIDVTRSDTPFPPIYNEDWLYLFDAAQRRSVAVAGTLSQLEYQPFAQSRRAASEEFGDVIAEGLFRLLHQGKSLNDATAAYWRSMLEQRFRLIDDIANRLLLKKQYDPVTGYALMSLAAARKRLADITEFSCLSFMRAWRTDVDTWREKLTNLPVLADLAGAAKYLGLPIPEICVTSYQNRSVRDPLDHANRVDSRHRESVKPATPWPLTVGQPRHDNQGRHADGHVRRHRAASDDPQKRADRRPPRHRGPNRSRRTRHYVEPAVGNNLAIEDHIGDFLSASALAIPSPGISSIFRFIRSSVRIIQFPRSRY
jgi:hypothetical protein